MSTGEPKSLQPILAPPPLDPAVRAARWCRASLRALERLADLLLIWQERSRQRHQLALLSDHMLRDIGLTRADVLAEATKRFWQR